MKMVNLFHIHIIVLKKGLCKAGSHKADGKIPVSRCQQSSEVAISRQPCRRVRKIEWIRGESGHR